MSNAHYTITGNINDDLNEWVKQQPVSRNQLIIQALTSLRGLPVDTKFMTDFEADPYGAAMSRIAQVLVEARKHMGSMSQGEWQILRLIRNVILEEDPDILPEEERVYMRLNIHGEEQPA